MTLPNGEVGYFWSVDIDLFDLGVYYEREAYGPSFKLRLFRKAEDGSWVLVPGISVNVLACLELLDAGALACPFAEEVRIRHPNYVPNISRGYVKTTNGKDFSRCVPNLESQADQIYRSHIKTDGYVKFQGDSALKAHNQGIVRFPDWVRANGTHDVRVAVSYNDDWGISTVVKNRPEEVTSWRAETAWVTVNIRTDYSHPGGMQAHGNVAAVAMEQPHDSSDGAQVLFVQSMGEASYPQLEILNTHNIPPWLANRYAMDVNSAAAAGFVKLKSGYFLLAVAGGDHGAEGVWFFESSETQISRYTVWHLVDVWKPTCKGWGSSQGGEHCWAGAAAAVNLLTDCGGDVYMYALSGRRGGGTDYSYTQLWRLEQDASGRVDPTFVLERRKSLGVNSAKDPSCRWACGVHTLTDGTLTMAAMIKQKTGSKNTIETYIPANIVPKSGIPPTYSDDSQDDPLYDMAMLPDDWTEEIEAQYDAETPDDP